MSHRAVVVYTLGHFPSLQAASLPELAGELALQGEHGPGRLQHPGPLLSLVVVDGGHLRGQVARLRAQLALPLPLRLLPDLAG